MASSPASPVPQQQRSRHTAERFIAAALDLLKSRTFSQLSVAELAAAADRSVGAFYQRFGSKDDFLEVLLIAFLERTCRWAEGLERATSAHAMLEVTLDRTFYELVANRNLWHAALQRSSAEPEYWDRFAEIGGRATALGLEAIERSAGRALKREERQRIALARQVFNSVINNQIINAPGPLRLDDPLFLPELRRIALAVAALD